MVEWKRRMDMPGDAARIIDTLEKHGYEAYIVGGCVRDAILGRKPGDWDITTSAKPLEVKALFAKTIDTGLQHGTVTVLMHGVGYEVTTYRIDGVYEDGRHPRDVSFTTNLRRDLERRDFTINAMAYNDRTGLVDVFDGLGDLQRGVIRCVGDAGQRFDEDALRMLRAVRFAGQLGFEIEENTWNAIAARARNLKKISAERIRVELTKLLVSAHAERLRDAYALGMTRVFLPEFDRMMQCDQKSRHHIYTVGEHSLRGILQMNAFFRGDIPEEVSASAAQQLREICGSLTAGKQKILVVTMLLHDVAKPDTMTVDEAGKGHFPGHPEKGAQQARQILKRLTFDNETVDTAMRLIRYHDDRPSPTARAVRRAAARIGRELMWMEFLVQYADVLSQNPDTWQEKLERLESCMNLYQEIAQQKQALSVRDLAVNGQDLIRAGIAPGPEMGKLLQMLLDVVLEHPERNTREQLLEILQEISETCTQQ